MKFTVSCVELLSRLQSIKVVINTKSILPVLGNFLVVGDNNMLNVKASDGEVTMETIVNIDQLDEPGRFTIPAKLLLDLLKNFPEQPLTFDINTKGNGVKIITNNSEYSLPCGNADDYPAREDIGESVMVLNVGRVQFLDGIIHTVFAVSDDELRPVMNCVLIEMNPDNFTFVATDGFKLVRYKRLDLKTDGERYTLLLPANSGLLLKNLLAKEGENLEIRFDGKKACFILGDYKMTCTLVEGRFPNYNAVIPQNNPIKSIIDKNELNSSLKRVSLMADQVTKQVILRLFGGNMEISSLNDDFATYGRETIPCQYDGDPITISFNSSSMQEILSNIDTQKLVLELSDPGRAGIFLPKVDNEVETDQLMLLMPMLIS